MVVKKMTLSDLMKKLRKVNTKLTFIEKYKLGVIKPSYAQSGFCTYCKVAFDLKQLEELDPEGTKQFMQQMGIEIG